MSPSMDSIAARYMRSVSRAVHALREVRWRGGQTHGDGRGFAPHHVGQRAFADFKEGVQRSGVRRKVVRRYVEEETLLRRQRRREDHGVDAAERLRALDDCRREVGERGPARHGAAREIRALRQSF